MDRFILCASVRSAYDGYEYYTEGRVVSVEHKGGGVYSGVVRGSGDAAYDVTVNIKRPRSGSCTCPHAAGRRIICKHMAALYFAALPERAGQYITEVEENEAEAEAYHGPSIIIAYAPCINHGINMTKSQLEMKKAVDTGYWQLFRYNPALADTDANPFTLDSKEPTEDYQSFLMGEVRYASLVKQNPDAAKVLFAKNEQDAATKRAFYARKAESNWKPGKN